MIKHRLGFFFGAGAELAYGFPTGGQFALDIFRRDSAPQKKKLILQLQSIPKVSPYAADWLPRDFDQKRISSFGKADHKSLLESSLENRSYFIRGFFECLDEEMAQSVADCAIDDKQLREAFADLTHEEWGTANYTHVVGLNEKLDAPDNLFGAEHLSAILRILQRTRDSHKDDPNLKQLNRCVVALLQLVIGSCSKELVSNLNQHIFEKAPNDLQVFDDIGGIFSIDLNKAGIDALEIVLEGAVTKIDAHTEPLAIFVELARRTLERLLSNCLDYQDLIDGHFRYLYCPAVEWSKFTKIAVFLSTVRDYMAEKEQSLSGSLAAGSGYYHDLAALIDGGLKVTAIGTSNYTSVLESVLGNRMKGISISKLNGSLADFYNPYLNRVETMAEQDALASDHLMVPFLFTQSGVKPLTSIGMSRRYVELYDRFAGSDALVAIGFGFNADDGHLNALFRSAVDEAGRPLIVFAYGTDARAEKNLLQKKLRIQNTALLHVSCINAMRQSPRGALWTEDLESILNIL